MRRDGWVLIPVGVALLLMAVVHLAEPEAAAVLPDPVSGSESASDGAAMRGSGAAVLPRAPGSQASMPAAQRVPPRRGIEPPAEPAARFAADRRSFRLGIADELAEQVLDAERLPGRTPDGRSLRVVAAPPIELRAGLTAGRFDAVIQIRRPSPHRGARASRVLLGDLVWVVVVHPSNPLRGLTSAQLRGVASGLVSNWNRVGGPDRRIRNYGGSGHELSGWRASSKGGPGESPEPLRTAELVATDPAGFGIVPLSVAVAARVSILAIDGLRPQPGTTVSRSYPLAVPVQLAVRGEGAADLRALAAALRPGFRWLLADRSWEVRGRPRRPGLDIGRPLSGRRRSR